MMVTWKEILVQEELRRHRLAQAEHARLIRTLLDAERPAAVRFYHRYLTALGQRLEHLGRRLQARYQPLVLNHGQQEKLLSGQSSGGCTS
jgi:hypothetical protein